MAEAEFILHIANHHRSDPPPIQERPGQYLGYFENAYGEQLFFVFTPADRTAVLFHGDADWQPCPVLDGRAVGLLLDRAEQAWLRACWLAATQFS